MSNIVPINPYPGHPLRALKQFAADADELVDLFNELDDLPDVVREKIKELESREQFDKLFADAKRTATLSEYTSDVQARCEAALQRFDPEAAYEDANPEANLKRSVIGERVAMLVGSFANASPGDPQVFVTAVIESICAVDVSLPALDAAIWQLTGTKKFIPAVSEVLEIMNEQQEVWGKRLEAIWRIDHKSRRTLERIEALEIEALDVVKKAQRAAKVRAVKQAQQKLKEAQRVLSDAEDSYCEANAALRDSEEAFEEAKRRVLECENDLARAEAVVNNNATASNDGQAV